MHKFSIKDLDSDQKQLRKRILEVSHELHFSHLGSCLTAVDLIDSIYKIKNKHDIFILSNGHAGIALYVVLEKYGFIKNQKELKKLNIHPDRNLNHDIMVSTGSLGQGLPIAIGMAIADRKRNIYCMLSDGECTEGSIWEALRVGWENKLHNLKIVINANGWSAYDKVNLSYLIKRISAFGYHILKTNRHDMNKMARVMNKITEKNLSVIFAYTYIEQFPFLNGLDAHYYILKQNDFDLAMKLLT